MQGGNFKALAIMCSLNQDDPHWLGVKVTASLMKVLPIKKHWELF